jgi:CRISPR-associated protein Cmr3
MSAFVLIPRDGLTVKDARGFNVAGGDTARIVPWPYPSTLAGAFRTAAGRSADFDERGDDRWTSLLALSIQGPLAVRRKGTGAWQSMFPSPADAIHFQTGKKSTIRWLRPVAPRTSVRARGAWTSSEEETRAVERLWRGTVDSREKPARMPRWWTRDAFLPWLMDPTNGLEIETVGTLLDGPTERVDTHAAIDPATSAAHDGALFSYGTSELLTARDEEWGLWGSWATPIEGFPIDPARAVTQDSLWTLGGETRLARVDGPGADPFAAPEELLTRWQPSRFFRLVLVTPAVFRRGWRPGWLEPTGESFEGPWNGVHLKLRAAHIGRAEAHSGWDFLKRAPKPSRRLVPMGSVFSFEADREITKDDVKWLWLSSMQELHAGEPSQDARDGFGLVVPGQWPDAGEQP